MGITLLCYTAIHFINLGVNAYTAANHCVDSAGSIISVNYMYSLYPENPMLALMYSMVPHPYFYMLLAIPIIAVYLLGVYAGQWIPLLKGRRKKECV